MKVKIQGELLLIIVGTWIVFGVIFHMIIIPLLNNQIFYCLLSFVVFGIFNYFITGVCYKIYVKLEKTYIFTPIIKEAY